MTMQTKRILVIDDNEAIMEMISEAMLSEGYDVNGMTSIQDIIIAVLNYQPDLVLMDYLLNGINGGEYCHQIKANPKTHDIPIIMISAYPKVLHSLGSYGYDEFIPKPFSLQQLTGSVRHHLQTKELLRT